MQGHLLLVSIDAHSKWMEVHVIYNVRTENMVVMSDMSVQLHMCDVLSHFVTY